MTYESDRRTLYDAYLNLGCYLFLYIKSFASVYDHMSDLSDESTLISCLPSFFIATLGIAGKLNVDQRRDE